MRSLWVGYREVANPQGFLFMTSTKLDLALNRFMSLNEKIAKKYGCTVSVQVTGPDGYRSDPVILVDHSKDSDPHRAQPSTPIVGDGSAL